MWLKCLQLVQTASPGAQDSTIGVRRYRQRASIRIGDTDGRIVIRRRSARLERFQDDFAAISRTCPQAGLGVHPDQLDPGRDLERGCRLVGERKFHEVSGDRCGGMTRLRVSAPAAWLVVTPTTTDNTIR